MQSTTRHNKQSAAEAFDGRPHVIPAQLVCSETKTLVRGDELDCEKRIRLTPKEELIVSLIRQGYSNNAICRGLRLSSNTVRWHMKNIYKKTGASDRNALTTMHLQQA